MPFTRRGFFTAVLGVLSGAFVAKRSAAQILPRWEPIAEITPPAAWNSGVVGKPILEDVQKMIEMLQRDRLYGPYYIFGPDPLPARTNESRTMISIERT